jgi:hypothetical protein
MGTIPSPNRGDNDAQRRSQRVMLKVTVVVLTQGTDNKSVSEVARTVTVNAHGAKLLLGLKVSIGQMLTLRHSRTGEEVSCRVVSALIKQRREKWGWILSTLPLDFGASRSLRLIGQCEAPKPKETESIALPNQLQKARNEI